MNERLQSLLDKFRDIEEDIERELEESRARFRYSIEQKRVRFEAAVLAHHRALRTHVSRYLAESGVGRILAAPLVYALIIPLVLLDAAVSLYQFVCFPVYGIRKVPRGDFIAVDRHHLAYLNPIEKLNCAYCGYANGVLAYTRAIAGRSEEHWCPIKHARRTRGQHRAYWGFAAYGDADGYRKNKEPDGL